MFEFDYPWVFVLIVLPFIISKLPLYYMSKRSALRISFKEDIDAVTTGQSKVSGISRVTPVQRVMSWFLFILILTALANHYT